jgi:hypothetical protein
MKTSTTPLLDCITDWFDRVWGQEDSEAIGELFISDGLAHGLGGEPMVGPDEFTVFHAALLKILKNVNIEVTFHMEQDEWISFLGVFRAESRETGEPVSMTGGAVCRFRDGKMIEAYNQWDFLSLFIALGLAPSDSFSRGISGLNLYEQS